MVLCIIPEESLREWMHFWVPAMGPGQDPLRKERKGMTIVCEQSGVINSREAAILECVANGMSAKEVARHINLAPRTVERYIEIMRIKLHARNSVHMVTRAIEQNVIMFERDKCG